MKIKILMLTVFFALLVCMSWAEVTLNPIFTDHMVLQRNHATHVYGMADPGEKIIVEFAGQKKEAVASDRGKWQVSLDPMRAHSEPATMRIHSNLETPHLTLSDVLVGDVWLCTGQSNMASMMKNYPTLLKDDIQQMQNSQVRMFKSLHEGIGSPEPSSKIVIDPAFKGSWQVMTPAVALEFSATASFFGKSLQPQAGVPIGLIYASRGGTEVNQWLPMDFMKSKSDLYSRYLGSENPWWKESKRNPGLIRAPSRLFNGTINPIISFSIKGCIWYQGESDVRKVDIYAEMFTDLITTWRNRWGYNFPFLFVQLAPYGGRAVNWDKSNQSWAFMREAQDAALALADTARAVIIDSGEQLDIHPQNKRPVGERLALLAGKVDNPAIIANSPVFDSKKIVGEKIQLRFKHVAKGLEVHRVAMNKKPKLVPGADPEAFVAAADTLTGFSICGADQKFVSAQAQIIGSDTVEVWAESVSAPAAVRYGWLNFPLCNLFNSAGLPASPFRTDSFALPDFTAVPPSGIDLTIRNERVLFSDSFDRPDGSAVVHPWVASHNVAKWRLSGEGLSVGQSIASHYVLYNGVVKSRPGEKIDISTLISSPTANMWGGLAFNYKDADNFYIARLKFGKTDVQLICYKEGAVKLIGKGKASQPFSVDHSYRMRLQAMPSKGVCCINITDPSTKNVLLRKEFIEDQPVFSEGYTGVYGGSVRPDDTLFTFDNFTFSAGQ